jgi:beta-galactosidase
LKLYWNIDGQKLGAKELQTQANGFVKILVFITVALLLSGHVASQKKREQNDDFFPPGPAASAYINFDNKGFTINGKRTFITSGTVHYPRVPQQNWHDILLKVKRAGFNTVETYIFWNYHEAKEGVYDFTSPGHDIGAFLDEAKKVGLYAIIRVGPYVCAEWENGGYPTWLLQKPEMEIRNNNSPQYFDAVSKWFNKLLPIISSRQIQKGGNVILVQLENEQPTDGWKYWGTTIYGKYFQLLLDLAHQNGLEVPMFFSGMHHSHDPAPNEPVDPATRKSPWISMELWTTWFDRYGNSGEDLKNSERHPWRVLANGGNGFNLYMFHGGSTFGFYNFNNDQKYGDKSEKGTTCYDFGTLVGQTGDTRELYLRLKRLGYFAETFSSILANGNNATNEYKDFVKGPKITARTSDAGKLVFIDNVGKDTAVVLASGIKMQLADGEIVGLCRDVALTHNVTITSADTRILGIVPNSNTVTVVCYGTVGDNGQIVFSAKNNSADVIEQKDGFEMQNATFKFRFSNAAKEQLLHFGKTTVRVLAMDKETANRTWFVETTKGKQVVIGAPYLGEFSSNSSGAINASVDYPLGSSTSQSLIVYGEKKVKLYPKPQSKQKARNTLPIANWKNYGDSKVLLNSYNDKDWFTLTNDSVPEMGQDGSLSPYAWYRTEINNATSIDSIAFSHIGDRANFYVDGALSASYDFRKNKSNQIPLRVPAGKHQLAVYVAYSGRNKFAGYAGSAHKTGFIKGLVAPVVVNGKDTVVYKWKMKGEELPVNLIAKATTVVSKQDRLPSYFISNFNAGKVDEGTVYRLQATGLSYGSVWLNGYNVGKYPEVIKDCPGLWLPSAWMKPTGNELIIYDEQGNMPDKVSIELEKGASRHRSMFYRKG